MNKKNMLFLAFIMTINMMHADSTTMFVPRIISMDSVFELALTNSQFHKEKEEYLCSSDDSNILSFKPFYQQSRSGESLARFFLPKNKTSIQLRENGTGDVDPLWINLIGASNCCYSSTICLRPERTSSGMVVTWYKDLSKYVDNLWIGINSAIVHTVHNMHFKELDRGCFGTLPGYATAADAFNSCSWTAGKIATKPLKRTGLDDIQYKIGYDFFETNNTVFSSYLVGTIPTGDRPNSLYLFEPLVGSKHASLGLGCNMNYLGSRNYEIMIDVKYNYLFSAKERRSLDLKNGDWSRYLWVITQEERFFVYPGINSFTRNLKVTPGSTLQIWLANHYHKNSWDFEIGYNFWLRGQEKVSLLFDKVSLPCHNETIGIFDMQILTPPVTTAHDAQIQQSLVGQDPVVSDSVFTPTTINDINVCSARNLRVLSNTFYGSCKYQFPCRVPIFVELNGSYEFASGRGALSQYAVWGAVTVQF